MAHHGKVWAYKPDGSACVFELIPGGEDIPPGWSHDITVITDPEKRTGEAVSAAARESLIKPVRVPKAGSSEPVPGKQDGWVEVPGLFDDKDEPVEEPATEEPLRYDQDLQQVLPPKPRGRGPLR
jgi:hypothetical protein